MRRVRRIVAAATIVVALLAATGCAAASDPDWQPPGWGEHDLAIVVAPEPVDPAAVATLVGQRVRNDAVGIQARFAVLPGVDGFDERVDGFVRSAIDSRAAQTGVAYTPQVFPRDAGLSDRACVRGTTAWDAAQVLADPALGPAGGSGAAVVCDIVAATGRVFGQRLRVIGGDPTGVTTDAAATFYVDVVTGQTATAAELWTPDAAGRLWQLIVEGLRRDAGSLTLAPVGAADAASLAAFSAVLDSTVPGPGGSLVLTVPAGFQAPELAALGAPPTGAPLAIGVPAATAATLTSPIGSALVAAAGAPFQPAPPVPPGRTRVDCDLVPCVALTYDDGPSELTPGILDALASHRSAATFFTMGSKAAGYGDLLRRMVAEGHLVENHTWNHPHLPDIPIDAAARQVHDTSGAIEAQTGERVTMFRPPYGEYTAEVLAAAGLPAILWDVDTLDWQGIPDDVLTDRVVDQPRPGSIVLQHDIQGNTGRTASAVYDGLLDRGFTLVTVAQLFGGQVPSSGAWRSGR